MRLKSGLRLARTEDGARLLFRRWNPPFIAEMIGLNGGQIASGSVWRRGRALSAGLHRLPRGS